MPKPGKTAARGYNGDHDALRAWWSPKVATGTVLCARCRRRIIPGTPWDLGHNDYNRALYNGPEHARCNRRAGALKGNKSRVRSRQRPARPYTSTWW